MGTVCQLMLMRARTRTRAHAYGRQPAHSPHRLPVTITPGLYPAHGLGLLIGEAQADAADDAMRLEDGEAPLGQDRAKRLLRDRMLAVVLAPTLPRRIEIGSLHAVGLADLAALRQPAANGVLR